jgi:cation diffusion facilitator CzcD-associated flavoprotein CzcO
VVQKYGLYNHIRFNTEVKECNWDDESKQWKVDVQVQGGKESEFSPAYTIDADFLVSAVGQLNYPQYPNIRGIDDFQGKLIHSARWDWSYDLAGKRIAVIGNGKHTSLMVNAKLTRMARCYGVSDCP